jgi:sec-independent protein translocase protein TatC
MTNLPEAIASAKLAGEHFADLRREQDPEGWASLVAHIREIRSRLVKMGLALAAGTSAGFVFFGPAWRVIERPLCSTVIRGHTGCHTLGVNQLVLDGPLDSFYLRVKVALIVGVILSSPVWLYQTWAFIAPGLYTRERRWGQLFLGTAIPLFLAGVALAYWSLGRTMRYLLSLTPHGIQNLVQVDQYMSFVITVLVAYGVAFEVPLLIIMLNVAGILTHERFRKRRRLIILVVFLIGGVANPSPDPLTMVILGGGCAALVEAAELVVWSNDRRRARRNPSPYAGLADNELSPLAVDDAGTREHELS